jgi:signal transduction histidine kinase
MAAPSPINASHSAFGSFTAANSSPDSMQAVPAAVIVEWLKCCLCASRAQYGAFLSVHRHRMSIEVTAKRNVNGQIWIQSGYPNHQTDENHCDLPLLLIQKTLDSKKTQKQFRSADLKAEFDVAPIGRPFPTAVICHPLTDREGPITGILYLETSDQYRDLKDDYLTLLDHLYHLASTSIRQTQRLQSTVSEEQQNDQSLHQKQLEEVQQEKMVLFPELNAEIRTQLASIIGFSQLLLKKPPQSIIPNEQRRFIEYIHHSGHQLLEIINNCTDQSGLEQKRIPTERGPLNLKLLVLGVYHRNRAFAAERSLSFRYRFGENLPTMIPANRTLLNQALHQLVQTIILASSQGQHLVIDTQTHQGNVRFYLEQNPNSRAEDGLRSDRSATNPQKPFTTRFLDWKAIGLEMVQRIAISLNGRIFSESAEERSRYCLELPLRHLTSTPACRTANCAEPGSSLTSSVVQNLPETLKQKINKDLHILLQTPVYMGGTSRRLIHSIMHSCEGFDPGYQRLLEKIKTAVLEGNPTAYTDLIKKALKLNDNHSSYGEGVSNKRSDTPG